MEPSVLHTPFGEVAFRKFGSGSRLLIAFHGFSEDGGSFREMGRHLEGAGLLYAIDLPFHGQTRWERSDYTPAQLAAVIDIILKQEGRRSFEAIGHSLGARLWLHLLPLFKEQARGLYLLAPDGLQTRWLYLVEWLPPGLRRWLSRLAQRPAWILAAADMLYRPGWIDGFLQRYLQQHLGEATARRRLLHTWQAISHFRLGHKKAARLIRQANTSVLVLLGSKDRLVDPKVIRRRLEGVERIRIEMIDATHRSICRRAASIVKKGIEEQP